jgi:hypothetical protein
MQQAPTHPPPFNRRRRRNKESKVLGKASKLAKVMLLKRWYLDGCGELV